MGGADIQVSKITKINLQQRGSMLKLSELSRQFLLALGIFFWLGGVAAAHSGMVDGYGCHRGRDKVSYHCHEGKFAGRTFKSKEEFLRQLRGGKSEQLAPKNNPPLPEKNSDTR
jgi:hypothetical protein